MKIKKKEIFVLIFLVFFLMVGNFLLITKAKYINEYIVLIFALYLLYCFFERLEFSLLYMFIYLFSITNVLSLYFLETNKIMLFELNRTVTLSTGGLLSFVFIVIVFHESLYFINKKNHVDKNKIKIKSMNYVTRNIYNILLIILLIYLFYALKYNYYNYELSKQVYMSKILGKNYYFELIRRSVIMFYPSVLGLYYFYTKKLKHIFVFIIWIVIQLLIGQKFSSLIFGFFYFIYPTLYFRTYDNKKIKKLLLYLIIIMLSFIVLNRYHWTKRINKGKFDIKIFKTYFINRFSQQNQLWWYFYKENNAINANVNLKEFKEDIYFTNTKNLDKKIQTGEFKLIKLVTTDKNAKERAKINASYATGTPAQLLYYSKKVYYVALFYVLYAFCFVKLNKIIIKFYNELSILNIISMIFIAKIYKNFYEIAIQAINKAFFKSFLFSILILFVINFLKKRSKNGKSRRIDIS